MKTIHDVIEIAGKAVNIRMNTAKYGYSDVGDILVSVLQNKMSNEEAIKRIEYLIEDYERNQ